MPEWLDAWVNYPGLELWKFVNLFVFILAALVLHRKFGRPVREALRSRGEGIKRELEKARADRDQAIAKLAQVEERLGRLDQEVSTVAAKARAEAEAEKRRIAANAEAEIQKIREQSQREIEAALKAAKHELRSFAAQESVRLAEGIIVKEMRLEDDVRLTGMRVEELGRTGA
jgi:F-type H+-transporting ATPase subunit b